MRILPVLFLLPGLVLTGSTAIANDDRPASPQPAVSPVPAPLTIESLVGTYKVMFDEKALRKLLSDVQKRSNNVSLEAIEDKVHQLAIKIHVNGTFERIYVGGSQRGKIKLNGNKLIFIDDVAELNDRANGSTNLPGCSECHSFVLYASADGKTLLVDRSINPLQTLIHGFVRQ